ncbi:tautomerase family protein [Millisia brevis]|uniref:tautomerase family protein n=1 Tax=Millisia brevis TaxID=264148 RepID=UPI00083719FE|nr:tautomerase family protein [Millisia brevis]
MPFYHCLPAPNLLDADRRSHIATEFTRIHTEVTGAPAAFVSVAFVDRQEGMMFTAGGPSQHSIISGYIRAGRDRETRAALLSGLSQAWHDITGQDPAEVVLGLVEIDATSTMEAGVIMPAPGEEAAWFATHQDKLARVLGG